MVITMAVRVKAYVKDYVVMTTIHVYIGKELCLFRSVMSFTGSVISVEFSKVRCYATKLSCSDNLYNCQASSRLVFL